MAVALTRDVIQRAPKVLLHDHPHLGRVAFEAAIDLARDGVVYAEIRFAPKLHLENGLTLHEVVESALEGFAHGMRDAELEGRKIIVRAILPAMRQEHRSETIAGLAVEVRR